VAGLVRTLIARGNDVTLIAAGVTGIVCDEPDELPAALHRVGAMDPADCRRDAEERFDLSVMAERYEDVYRAVRRKA